MKALYAAVVVIGLALGLVGERDMFWRLIRHSKYL